MKQAYEFVSSSMKFDSEADARQFSREELIYNVSEDIQVIMEEKRISKVELANRLSKSKSFVTQVLSGARNMTLGTLSDICFALNFKPKIKLVFEPEVAVLMKGFAADVPKIISINANAGSRYSVARFAGTQTGGHEYLAKVS